MKNSFVCKWKGCSDKFSERSALQSHVVAHVDEQELTLMRTARVENGKSPGADQPSKSSTQNAQQSEGTRPAATSEKTTPKAVKETATVTPGSGGSAKKNRKTTTASQQSSQSVPTSTSESAKGLGSPKNDDDIICRYCRSPKFLSQNQIVMCDKCGNWYHQLCHIPFISNHYIKSVNTQWLCRDCKG